MTAGLFTVVAELGWIDRDWYRIGALDFVTAATYMLLVLITITSLEEILVLVCTLHLFDMQKCTRRTPKQGAKNKQAISSGTGDVTLNEKLRPNRCRLRHGYY